MGEISGDQRGNKKQSHTSLSSEAACVSAAFVPLSSRCTRTRAPPLRLVEIGVRWGGEIGGGDQGPDAISPAIAPPTSRSGEIV